MKSCNKVYMSLYDETLRYLEAKFPEAGSDVVMEAAAWMAARTLVAVNDSYMTLTNRHGTTRENTERDSKRRANIMRECEK